MTTDMTTVYAHYRVNTQRQGKSRLGLDAQQQVINAFCAFNSIRLIAEFIEEESVKRIICNC